ncbi:hypothetical protein FV222_00180 [Methylobacterium sp. WL103]|uniref:hypothetical protein n=1 Tax=Methylobacterium sp. WL103 TaxID=2603891 RepID=UPI0011CB85F6|nr:hypothetical protein [Methylobacterium sp. WL103]TXN08923.1 hypothetical protein FV222_00180 [Methylobacterium sp. WL103]
MTSTKTQNVAEYRAAFETNYASRIAFETAEHNDNLVANLNKYAKNYFHDAVFDVLMTAKVDANFMNAKKRDDSFFNVYSVEKVLNVAKSAAQAETLNAYTRHVFLTALNLTRASSTMTHKDAQACICLDLKASPEKDAHIVRFVKNIAASTANSQSSSSIAALRMFDVLVETRDEANNVAYKVNMTSNATKRIAKFLNVTL